MVRSRTPPQQCTETRASKASCWWAWGRLPWPEIPPRVVPWAGRAIARPAAASGEGLCALQHPPQMRYEIPPPSVLHVPPPHTAKASRALPVLRMLPACSSCTSHGARACARAYSYCWKAPRRPACRRSPRAPPASLGTRMCEVPAQARLKLSAQLLPQMQGAWG